MPTDSAFNHLQQTDMAVHKATQSKTDMIHERISLNIEGTNVDVALTRRNGTLPPIVFLHGFGSTKEDYLDIVYHSNFSNRPFIAYDAPGCGETTCENLNNISIPFLVNTTLAILDYLQINKFHLQGHSMGGLTALILAHQIPSRILSFTNIKGNLAPEDCFLSRQIISHSTDDPAVFFSTFIERTRVSPYYSSAIFAASLPHKVRVGAVRPIFESMVDFSDNGDLMAKFLSLPCPRMYMYGDQFASLSYLKGIEAEGVEVAEISHAGHFPMYSNPVEMWRRMGDFIRRSERGGVANGVSE